MADLTVSGANGGMYPLGNDGDSARVEGQQKPSIFSFEQDPPTKVGQSDDDIKNKLIKMQLNNIVRLVGLLGEDTNDATLASILTKIQSMDINKIQKQIADGEEINESTYRNVENVEKELCKYFGIRNTTMFSVIIDELEGLSTQLQNNNDLLELIKAKVEGHH